MKKKDFYNKGLKDASDIFDRKFNEVSVDMKEGFQCFKDAAAIDREIMGQIINQNEKLDMDIDKLYKFLGEEREYGDLGNAIVTEAGMNNMLAYTNGVLNKYNSFTNINEVEISPQFVDAVADFLTNMVENNKNQKFHNSLTVLEQNGIISQEKFELHKQSVKRAKQMTALGVYASFSVAPIAVATIGNYLQKKDIEKFIIGVYGYINRELTPMITYDIQSLMAEMGIKINQDKIRKIFKEYCNNTGISNLPFFSTRNRNAFGNDGMEVLSKEIVSRCDLKDVEVRSRALDFLNHFLRIDYLNAEIILRDSQTSQNCISDITWLSAINYRYVYMDFIKDIENSRNFANYNISNDPFRVLRETRREQMETLLHETSSKKSLFLSSGKRKDIIDTSAKLMQFSLNPKTNIDLLLKMSEREKKVLEYYGL